jgi:hypothetical protein
MYNKLLCKDNCEVDHFKTQDVNKEQRWICFTVVYCLAYFLTTQTGEMFLQNIPQLSVYCTAPCIPLNNMIHFTSNPVNALTLRKERQDSLASSTYIWSFSCFINIKQNVLNIQVNGTNPSRPFKTVMHVHRKVWYCMKGGTRARFEPNRYSERGTVTTKALRSKISTKQCMLCNVSIFSRLTTLATYYKLSKNTLLMIRGVCANFNLLIMYSVITIIRKPFYFLYAMHTYHSIKTPFIRFTIISVTPSPIVLSYKIRT